VSELEQRLAAVELELHQLKSRSAALQQHPEKPSPMHSQQQPVPPAAYRQEHNQAKQPAPDIPGFNQGTQPAPGMPGFNQGTQPASGMQSVNQPQQPGSRGQGYNQMPQPNPGMHPPASRPAPGVQGFNQPQQQPGPGRQHYHHTQQQAAFNAESYQASPWNAAQQPEKRSMESVLVKYVLPIVFIIVLLIGILMLFIAGIAFGLITEPVRCLLGLILAAGMYTVGLIQQRNKRRPILGKALLGGAHGVLLITISVAHLSYEIIGVVSAALFYLLSCGLVIFSAIRWRSQLLVCIAIVSAYICVFLIDTNQVHAVPLLLIQLLISVSMIILSTKLRYRIANGLAYFLLHFSLMATSSIYDQANNSFLIAALLTQHLVVFVQYMRSKQILPEYHVMQAVGVLAIMSWMSYIYSSQSVVFSAVSLLIAVSYAVSILYYERQELAENHPGKPHQLRIEISVLISAFSLLCFFINLLGRSYLELMLYVIGVVLILYGLRDRHYLLRWIGAAFSFIGVVGVMFSPLKAIFSYEVLCWVVILASFLLIYHECKRCFEEEKLSSEFLSTVLWIEAALAFWFVTIMANLLGKELGSPDSAPYFVSFAWLFYAIAAIVIGTMRQLSKARLTGIILLLVIAVKVVFIDITFLNILIKSLLFTVLGGVGIGVSYFLYNKTDNQNK